MCFSASASFGAGALLLGAGVASLKAARKPEERLFACIPLLFSIQQIAEGSLWLSLTHPAYAAWETPSTYIFYLFAQVLWPVWVPYAMLHLEKSEFQRLVLRFLLAAGIILAVYLLLNMLKFGVNAEVAGHHIRYGPKFPFGTQRTVLYILVIGIPFFISTYKGMPVFGGVVMAGLVITQLFFKGFLLSVWCFFAALASVMVWWIIRQHNRQE